MKTLSEKLDGDITVEKIHLKPFTTLIIKNISIVDRNPASDTIDSTSVKIDTFFRAEYIIAQFSFEGLLANEGFHLDRAMVQNAQMNLVIEDKEDSGNGDVSTDNLSRIFGIVPKENPKKSEKEIFHIKKVEIRNMGFAMKNYLRGRHRLERPRRKFHQPDGKRPTVQGRHHVRRGQEPEIQGKERLLRK